MACPGTGIDRGTGTVGLLLEAVLSPPVVSLAMGLFRAVRGGAFDVAAEGRVELAVEVKPPAASNLRRLVSPCCVEGCCCCGAALEDEEDGGIRFGMRNGATERPGADMTSDCMISVLPDEFSS